MHDPATQSGHRLQKYRPLIGYDKIEPRGDFYMERSNSGARKGPWPEVAWMKVTVLTATIKAASPPDVEASYREWSAWKDFIQEVRARLPPGSV
jgi:hypothetical protein